MAGIQFVLTMGCAADLRPRFVPSNCFRNAYGSANQSASQDDRQADGYGPWPSPFGVFALANHRLNSARCKSDASTDNYRTVTVRMMVVLV